MNDGFKMELFGGQQGKPFPEITTHLVTKHTDRTRTCPISFPDSIFQNKSEEIMVDFQSPAI